MSNGTGQSKAPYIIICAGRIDLLAAAPGTQPFQRQLKAASDAACNLVSYFGDRLTAEQTAPISRLQHSMMDNFDKWGAHEAEIAIEQMFELLDELEDQMSG